MSRGPRAIVAGAGPAGAAAAIWLARAGCSTTIITRDSRHAVSRGETFAEAGLEALRVLGVRDRFLAAEHRPCRRTCVAWGESALTTHDHLFRLHGNGWQIDRALFDSMLGEAAEAAGVRVVRGASVTGVERFDPRWSVQFLTADGPLTEECEWLIDATGRCAALSRMIGARWVETDHLIAQIGRFASRSDRSAGEGVLLVESAEHGWWYSVVPPDGTLLAAHVTDRDRTARGRWALELESTQHTRDRVRSFALIQLCGCSASIGYLVPAAGPGWAAVGDAALAHDPLSGQGLVHALLTGMRGAEALCRGESITYANARARDGALYLRARRDVYRFESRWAGSDFWRRRREAEDRQ
jgi:flavin-dependent dehydrogenase